MARLGAINSNSEPVYLNNAYPELVIFKALGVDATTIADTSLGTTDVSKRFYPITAIYRVASANTIGVVPTASIGTNSVPYDNISVAVGLAGLTALNLFIKQDLSISAVSSVDPSTQIFTKISVGAVAVAMTLDVHLIGYYL